MLAPFAAIAAGAKLATASEMPRIAANEIAKIVFEFINLDLFLKYLKLVCHNWEYNIIRNMLLTLVSNSYYNGNLFSIMEQVLFDHNEHILFFLCIITGALSAVISWNLLRIYKLFSSSYIFALVIGFGLISLGDFLFSGTIEFVDNERIFNFLHWLQLSIVTYGFAFIGLVYYFQKFNEKKISSIVKTVLASLILVGMTILIIGLQNTQVFPKFQEYNEYFRIVNMIMLGYFVFRTIDNPELRNRKDWILMPFGFAILFAGQFQRFLFTIDPESIPLVASVVLKIAGLAVLLYALHRKSNQKLVGVSNKYAT